MLVLRYSKCIDKVTWTCIWQFIQHWALLQNLQIFSSELLSHEDVIQALQADTLTTGVEIGLGGGQFQCGFFAQIVNVVVKVCLFLCGLTPHSVIFMPPPPF